MEGNRAVTVEAFIDEYESELSVRLLNVLRRVSIDCPGTNILDIGLRYRGVGPKTMEELKEIIDSKYPFREEMEVFRQMKSTEPLTKGERVALEVFLSLLNKLPLEFSEEQLVAASTTSIKITDHIIAKAKIFR